MNLDRPSRASQPRSPARRPLPRNRMLAAALAASAAVGLTACSQPARPRAHPSASAGTPSPGSSAPATEAAAAGGPAFLVTTAEGKAAVRSARTGHLVADIPRPRQVYAYEGVAGAADDRTFFLAGATVGSGRWAVSFFRVTIGSHGRPGRVAQLPGSPLIVPTPVISGGWVSFDLAVSPDGREIAFASGTQFPSGPGTPYGPPLPVTGANERLIVQSVATGSRRSWHAWKSAEAVITQLSWGAGGLVGYDLAVAHASARGQHLLVPARTGHVAAAFMVLRTAARGADLIGDSELIASSAPPQRRKLASPAGVVSGDSRWLYWQQPRNATSGQLTAMSLAPGRQLKFLLSGRQALLGDPMSVDASGRYLLFPVLVRHRRPVNTQVPFLEAHLARFDVRTRALTVLPIPIIAEINGAFDAAW